MELNIQKEEFSYAYVHAVASAAGYTFERAPQPLDRVGVDVIITSPKKIGSKRRPQLELQVKSTSRTLLTDDVIRYSLSVKNYEELREYDPQAPLILVVVLLPENVEEWVEISEDELCLKRCAYWRSLQGQPSTTNKTNVTVQIPRKNVFGVDAIKNIMESIARGVNL
ncbi:MAG: DUF4365 domain-containing protein [Okeania sp. SIO2H7]|nr:DUF4365 domain-containing protein [Okeania sp. SIO2H7]